MAGAGVPKPRTNKDFTNEKKKIGDKGDNEENGKKDKTDFMNSKCKY